MDNSYYMFILVSTRFKFIMIFHTPTPATPPANSSTYLIIYNFIVQRGNHHWPPLPLAPLVPSLLHFTHSAIPSHLPYPTTNHPSLPPHSHRPPPIATHISPHPQILQTPTSSRPTTTPHPPLHTIPNTTTPPTHTHTYRTTTWAGMRGSSIFVRVPLPHFKYFFQSKPK